MLSERQLQAVLKIFEDRMQDISDDYMRRMGEHIRDLGKLTDTDRHRIVRMKRMNANVEAIKRRIAREMGGNIADVERVFLAAAESDARFMATIFGEDHAPTVKGNKPLERILKAQLRVTGQQMANLSQTTLLSEGYRRAVDVAVSAVQAGYTDYNSAVRSAIREAAGEGLRVRYPNSGLTRRLDTAVRQNILDGVRSINQDVLTQLGKDFGADGVELDAHALCAEDHLPWQGRQYSNREFADLQASLERKIGTWNCKHTAHPILLGISQPTYSDAELEAFRRNSTEEIEIDGRSMTRYAWTQEQRRLETEVRKQKDIAVAAKASGDDVLRREAQGRINDLTAQYEKISDRAGLIEQRERMSVAGFRQVKTAAELKKRTEYGTMRSYSEMLEDRKIVVKSKKVRALPIKGDKDSITDFMDPTGKQVLQRRVYDYQGRAAVDFDTSNHGNELQHPTGAHKHLFDYTQQDPRGTNIPLTELDLWRNRDIIQRGVNYFDPK